MYIRHGMFWLTPQLVNVAVPLSVSVDSLLTYWSAEGVALSVAWHLIQDAVFLVDPGIDWPSLGPVPKFELYTYSP